MKIYQMFLKRPLDIVLSLTALIVLSPILVITAILVAVNLGSPVLFKQARPGLNEKIFNMYKFRSMNDLRDKDGNLLPDHIRLTRFGKLLRASSLDELPELFNILKGDMSIVGPRPLLVQYLPLYNEHQKKRHLVRPGLTGLAQVNGRNAISWEDKFDFDVRYVENITFIEDWKLILLTIKKVLYKDGINSNESVTMSPFRGNEILTKGSSQMSSFYTKEELISLGLKKTGKNVQISRKASIYMPETISIGDDVRIDDFCCLVGGKKGIHIGSNVHIAFHCIILGNGGVTIEDFAGLSSRCSIYSATDDYSGMTLTNPTIPSKFKNVIEGEVHLGKHAIVGTNTTILPNVNIGEGVSVGANSLVTKNLDAWGIYVGSPARKIKERSTQLLSLESEYLIEKNNSNWK